MIVMYAQRTQMMNLNQMPDLTRDDLRDKMGLSENEILTLDREAQNILGKTIMMVDTALRDASLSESERIEAGLNFIHMGMALIENNLEVMVDSKVDKSKLPKALRNKTNPELRKIVAEQSFKRKEIRVKIKEFDKKRRKFVVEKQKSGTKKDELNSVMIQAIKDQAKLKNYSW